MTKLLSSEFTVFERREEKEREAINGMRLKRHRLFVDLLRLARKIFYPPKYFFLSV